MSLKTYDGWTSVTSEDGRKAVLAKFTKDDDSIVHYNFAALQRIKKKPSENFDKSDLALVSKAINEGPKFFNAYTGWRNLGRGGKSIIVCTFTKASGEKIKRGLASLMNMTANPPPKFSPYDKAILDMAIKSAPIPKP